VRQSYQACLQKNTLDHQAIHLKMGDVPSQSLRSTIEQKLKIPSEPVFHGIAATPGRLFLSLKNGKVICLK